MTGLQWPHTHDPLSSFFAGPNGAGKSTVAQGALGIDEFVYDGEVWEAVRRRGEYMKIQGCRDVTRVMREDRQAIDSTLAKGARDAMVRHKKDNLPVVIERHRKIEWVKPKELGY